MRQRNQNFNFNLGRKIINRFGQSRKRKAEQSLRLSLAQLIFPVSDHLSIIETAEKFLAREKIRGSGANLTTEKVGLTQNLIFNQSPPNQQSSNIELLETENCRKWLNLFQKM